MDSKDFHLPVLLVEAIEALAIKPEGVYLDATFGRGGHSRAILTRLGPAGRLLAFDRDPDAIAAGAQLAKEDGRFTLLHRPFSELAEGAAAAGLRQFDGILFDLGLSSPQIDNGARGFSFRHDAPLDMRMDPSCGEGASEWLMRADVREITEVIRDYGDERFAFQIAKKIVAARAERPIVTTGDFASLVRATVRTREPGQDPATRSFQAVRIHINRELEELALALPQAETLLNPGGRLAVIAFHSLEDRIVKRFLRERAAPDPHSKRLPLRADELPGAAFRLLGKARPTAAEIAVNPRSRSAILRVAEKS
ncbi:MAG: 16S rRNA (cytosine(1402)-N(4))-methyltransferase RsmH [Zoogloeaceae bacterium]|jgi:16S rRNA (cytosine1402-N4)-methyltransferase|nr:16S rRNA (cytosine(1402)-N(4))-methyltransferase RsmH [Zoogloeaceae bacterium]